MDWVGDFTYRASANQLIHWVGHMQIEIEGLEYCSPSDFSKERIHISCLKNIRFQFEGRRFNISKARC